MKKRNVTRSLLFIALPIGLLFFLFLYSQEDNPETPVLETETIPAKQKGVHDFGINNTTDFEHLRRMNVEWVALVPWGFQKDYDGSVVSHHHKDSLYMEQHNKNWLDKMNQVRNAGFKIFVKPHVWINEPTEGTWRSNIFPNSETDWESWKASYRHFIIRYAKIAEQAQAEMFCIGVEFSRLSVEKPDFWKELIKEVKSIYSGKLTYAANWHEEYEKITFWDQLDYIGIQAYFPLVDHEYPSVEEISEGWNRYLPTMEAVSNRFDKKILFTEMGYKSTSDGAMKPWEWVDDPYNPDYRFSAETQTHSYEAFFNTVWPKKWFTGAYIWQVRSDFVVDSTANNKDFTPQGKPAEKIITEGFK